MTNRTSIGTFVKSKPALVRMAKERGCSLVDMLDVAANDCILSEALYRYDLEMARLQSPAPQAA